MTNNKDGGSLISKNNIPPGVVRRMPRYFRYLAALKQMGISRVSSKDLSKRMGYTSSQIRQDFWNLGRFGLQGYGYDVDFLYEELRHILGLDKPRSMIIIGAGHLGKALSNHLDFEKVGFSLVALFDIDIRQIGQSVRGVPILHYDGLKEFLVSNTVDIAIITVPRTDAYEVVQSVTKMGIKGVWNFTPMELEVPDDVVVENIHLGDSLIVLGFLLP